MTLPTPDTTSMPLGPGGPDWLVTPGLVAHPAATAFMESRVAAILDGTAPEAVEVPTDAGRYQLVLNRKHADAPWLVSRITPVEEVN